jgi:hypothetical protein
MVEKHGAKPRNRVAEQNGEGKLEVGDGLSYRKKERKAGNGLWGKKQDTQLKEYKQKQSN